MNGDRPGAGSAASARTDPDLGEALRRASHAQRHRFAELLKPWDLSPHQFRALRVIAADEPLRLSELAERLRIAARSVTDVVDGLTARGLAERTPDPADRRATTVRLTRAGRTLLDEIEHANRANLADFFGRLTRAERRQLAELLGKLTDPPG